MLISALVLALLYFALMELLMIDGSRALSEARRFRARVVAAHLAENAAELAAIEITTRLSNKVEQTDGSGRMEGEMRRNGESFVLMGTGDVSGTETQSASVRVQGRLNPNGTLAIDYTMHGQ